MKTKIFLLFFYPSLIFGNPLSDFAKYTHNQNFLERYITADGIRIGVREVDNYPFSENIKTWIQSIENFLVQNGYIILEKQKRGDFEVIKSKLIVYEKSYIYGVALRYSSTKLLLIEFSGEEEIFHQKEKQIFQFIEHYKKK